MDLYSNVNYYNIWNLNYSYGKFRPSNEIFFVILRQFFIGSKVQPGFIRALLMCKKEGLKVLLVPLKIIKPIFQGLNTGMQKRKRKSLF
jgi:hypothetical protein